jgi:hypothetical protein
MLGHGTFFSLYFLGTSANISLFRFDTPILKPLQPPVW